jgi:hypothetical protein
LILLFVIVGFIAGALAVMAWTERERRQAEAAPQAARKAGDPGSQSVPRPDRVRILRDPKSQALVVEWNGQPVSDVESRFKAEAMVREWLAALATTGPVEGAAPASGNPDAGMEGSDFQAAASEQLVPAEIFDLPFPDPAAEDLLTWQPPEPASAAAGRAVWTPADSPGFTNPFSAEAPAEITPLEQAFPEPPAPQAAPSAPVFSSASPAVPIASPPGKPADPAAGKKSARPKAPASIVTQINDILQEQLAGTPQELRGIRLAEDASQAVTVWVGVDHFDGIDAVKDPEVRGLIRNAVAEWERRNEAGARR